MNSNGNPTGKWKKPLPLKYSRKINEMGKKKPHPK